VNNLTSAATSDLMSAAILVPSRILAAMSPHLRAQNFILNCWRERCEHYANAPFHSDSRISVVGTCARFVPGSRIPEMIDKALLEILVCPACKTPLVEKNGGLKCSQCRRLYPVRDNIPIMLIDEATIEPQ